MKSEESSNWWKPGSTKENLKYDEYKPQAAEPKQENKFTRVQIEEDEDEEEEKKDAELGKKLEE